MAKVGQALFQLSGAVGEIQFRKTRFELMERLNSGISSEPILSGERFERSRLNNRRFKKVKSAVTEFQAAVLPLIQGASDNRHSLRLTSLFTDILKRDIMRSADNQRFLARNLSMMLGFEFNESCSLFSVLGNNIQVERMDKSSTHRVRLPIFSPTRVMEENASHIQVSISAVVMNPEVNTYKSHIRHGQYRPLTHMPIIAETISFEIPPISEHVLCVIVSVKSYKKEGANYRHIGEDGCNAAAICYVGGLE